MEITHKLREINIKNKLFLDHAVKTAVELEQIPKY